MILEKNLISRQFITLQLPTNLTSWGGFWQARRGKLKKSSETDLGHYSRSVCREKQYCRGLGSRGTAISQLPMGVATGTNPTEEAGSETSSFSTLTSVAEQPVLSSGIRSSWARGIRFPHRLIFPTMAVIQVLFWRKIYIITEILW